VVPKDGKRLEVAAVPRVAAREDALPMSLLLLAV